MLNSELPNRTLFDTDKPGFGVPKHQGRTKTREAIRFRSSFYTNGSFTENFLLFNFLLRYIKLAFQFHSIVSLRLTENLAQNNIVDHRILGAQVDIESINPRSCRRGAQRHILKLNPTKYYFRYLQCATQVAFFLRIAWYSPPPLLASFPNLPHSHPSFPFLPTLQYPPPLHLLLARPSPPSINLRLPSTPPPSYFLFPRVVPSHPFNPSPHLPLPHLTPFPLSLPLLFAPTVLSICLCR